LRFEIGRLISSMISIEEFKSRVEVVLPELGSDAWQLPSGMVLLFWHLE
jgi:hypothetical protein